MHTLKLENLSSEPKKALKRELQNYFEIISIRLSKGRLLARLHEPNDKDHTLVYDFKNRFWRMFKVH